MDAERYNVLLVDDDQAQVELALRAVSESCPEIELTIVGGGDAVLDWFSSSVRNNERKPDLILLDLKLPKLEGLAVLRKLRSQAAAGDIPIVVFSTEHTQADVQMSYRAGANSFVAKPTNLAEFTECFRERLAYWMSHDQLEQIRSAKDAAADQV
jgi:two-component system, response regulator